MPTVCITGANRGLGLEFARQYAADGWRVIAACRNPAKATALKALGPKVEIHPLVVADLAAVQKFGRAMQKESIDLLIANAGILRERTMSAAKIDEAAWIETFKVNSIAPLAVAGALLEPVKRSQGRRMVAISSYLGSIGSINDGGHYTYRASKAALNCVWRILACENPDLIVTVLSPGWVKTDMGGPSAPLEAKDSIANMRKVIAALTPEKSGRFLRHDGSEIPW